MPLTVSGSTHKPLSAGLPASQTPHEAAARAALGAELAACCSARLARVAGTHGLLLDGLGVPPPRGAGIACWTTLRPAPAGDGWRGPLRARVLELPCVDDSLCVVLACCMGAAGATRDMAAELARVLAPHGTLLVAGLHPCSLWPGGVSPGRWERHLRAAGLSVKPAQRLGAPWPREAGSAGLPQWLARGFGGAYVIEARRSVLAVLPLRPVAAQRSSEPATLLPGARRQCA